MTDKEINDAIVQVKSVIANDAEQSDFLTNYLSVYFELFMYDTKRRRRHPPAPFYIGHFVNRKIVKS